MPRPAWTSSRMHGTPEPPPDWKIVPAFSAMRFEKPTSLQEIPHTGRMLVSNIGGQVLTFAKDAAESVPDVMLDLGRGAPLQHATVHPEFAENGFLFVSYAKRGTVYVSRFSLASRSPLRADPDSEVVLLTRPGNGHKAGCLRFGNDGYLYIATGDGSGPNPPDGLTAGQDVSNLLGAILRIDVDRKAGDLNYAVPADNPFIDLDGARPEIWAYGLRNPWKFGIDPKTGNMFAADNGWETWEMIHQIVRGGNCGWPIMEGRAMLRTEVKRGPTPIRPPVKDHPHTEANSVIGGPVYRGSKLPGLDGTFVYGDYITGTIWGLRAQEDGSFSHSTLVDTDLRISAFAEGSRGELWVVDYDYTGQIYELQPSGLEDRSDSFPRRLSETGLFKSVNPLVPADGVVPYDVVVKRWMDGADSRRWVAIPGTGHITLADGDVPQQYPPGTVFVKHLTLPSEDVRGESIPLETQLLHFEYGQWNPYSYVWDDQGNEAHLADSIGADRALRIPASSADNEAIERNWHINAVNECRLCHNAGSHFVLGFVPGQLDAPGRGAARSASQLKELAVVGVIERPANPVGSAAGRLVDPHDVSQSIDDRARSYLHANCSMCHHPRGNAIVSFYLRRDLPFEQLRTGKGTGIGTFGMADARIIVPGDPYRSVLMYRMSKLGYSRMPYIGSRMVDSAGVALIEGWIRSLPGGSAEENSAPVRTATAEATSLELLARPSDGRESDRESAIRTLVESTEGSLALIARMHAGSLSGQNTQMAAAIGYSSSRSDIRGLFETFIPESERRVTLGPNPDPQSILTLTGDVDRGRLIFSSDAARCRTCHDATDASKSTGPTLAEINKKHPRRFDLVQHILKPSLKIDEKFVAWIVLTVEGKVFTGLLVEKSADEVVLKTADRRTVRISLSDVEEMRKSKLSLMPERILSDLNAQEAADLVAYLRSIRM